MAHLFKVLGLPGCVSSMDGVHLAWDNCPARYTFLYKGKEGYPTVAFNVHCDHIGRVLAVNGPHPGGRNDKTMARLDEMLVAVRTDAAYTDMEYDMYDADGALKRHKGAWVLCDGGYHRWRTTICGYKHSVLPHVYHWSKRCESVRKNVEDLFGIMKKRHRILRLPFLLTTEKGITDTFKTCCVLHNMLLAHTGQLDVGLQATDWKFSLRSDTDRVRAVDTRFAEYQQVTSTLH